MRYEGDIYRPPSEARSLIIQVTVGCSHNQCTFCSMYKNKRFRVRKVDEVIADLFEMRAVFPNVRRIFLADGDALIAKTDYLLEILSYIYANFPQCERVTSYGTPKSILLKSEEDLRQLAQSGLSMIYLGLESGNNEILKKICKGESAEEIIEAGKKVKRSGMKLSVTAINGIGGVLKMKEHAVDTGKALSAMNPDYIGLLTLMLEQGTPLYEEVMREEFALLTPSQAAEETILLLENTNSEGSVFRSNHASNYISLRGRLNEDKPRMITELEDAIRGDRAYKSEYMRRL